MLNINNVLTKPYNSTKISFKEQQDGDLLDPFNDDSKHRLKTNDVIPPAVIVAGGCWLEELAGIREINKAKYPKFLGAFALSLIPAILVDRVIRKTLFNKEDEKKYSMGHRAYNALRMGGIYAGIYKLMEATKVMEKGIFKTSPYPILFLIGIGTNVLNQFYDPFGLNKYKDKE